MRYSIFPAALLVAAIGTPAVALIEPCTRIGLPVSRSSVRWYSPLPGKLTGRSIHAALTDRTRTHGSCGESGGVLAP